MQIKQKFKCVYFITLTLSPRTDVYLKPFPCASSDPVIRFVTIFGLMYKSLSLGLPLF